MATPDPAPLGLRERKNRRTRLAIVRAASELTIEENYAAATIARIAERADIAPRTVSTWFPSKDDILFEGADATIERGVEHLTGGQGDVVDRLLAWFEDEANRRDAPDPELERLRNDAIQHDPELRARYHQLFARGQAAFAQAAADYSGVPADNLGPKLFAGAAVAFIEELAAMSISEDSPSFESPQFTSGVAYLKAALAAITAGD